ncbi:MAG: glycosyltransferase family 4 protein [Methyloligellaceae bacterium]
MTETKKKRVLIIVENLTIPVDRRVWQEATALRDAGYHVSIICPVGDKYHERYEVMEDIHVYRHTLLMEADTKIGYLFEYSSALFWEFWLSMKVLRRQGFDVIHACNPPDLIFLIGLFYKIFFRKKFIFDHHDINPELFEVKFGRKGFFHSLLLMFERWTFKSANVSIATNGTFKDIAVARGGMDPEDVFIVQSTPNLQKFKRVEPSAELRAGRKHVIGYVGIMGNQDGVDILVESMKYLVKEKQRTDLQCVIVGSGTELEKLKQMTRDYKLEDHITFTGYLSGDDLLQAYSTFDVGVIPDPENVYNDKISMNKVFEYMAMGIPFVQFNLSEGRAAAGEASLYARDNCPKDLAEQVLRLVNEPDLCEQLKQEGQKRAEHINWDNERAKLLAAYDRALNN